MSTKARVWLAGLGLVALGISLYPASTGSAGDDQAVRDGVLKIAAALEKGDDAAAKTQAKTVAAKVEDIETVMNLMKLRSKGGVGVGKKGSVQPDGIEVKLNALFRDAPPPGTVNKEAAALEEMAYRVAAIAEVAIVKPPKDEPKAKQAKWIHFAKELRKAAPALASAAKSKSSAEIQKAAGLINTACNNCHTDFK